MAAFEVVIIRASVWRWRVRQNKDPDSSFLISGLMVLFIWFIYMVVSSLDWKISMRKVSQIWLVLIAKLTAVQGVLRCTYRMR